MVLSEILLHELQNSIPGIKSLESEVLTNKRIYYKQSRDSIFVQEKWYLLIKRNKLLAHATLWMDFKNIMSSERSQTLNSIYSMIPFI